MKLKKIASVLTAILIALSSLIMCGVTAGAKSNDFQNTEWHYEAASLYGLTFSICKNTIKSGYTSAVFTFDAQDYRKYVTAISNTPDAVLSANVYINDTYHIYVYFYGKADRFSYGTLAGDTAIDSSTYEFIATINEMGCPSLILSYRNDSDIASELQKNVIQSTINYMGYIGNPGENVFCGDSEWYTVLSVNDFDIIEAATDISSLSFSKITNKAYTGKAIKPAVTIKDGDKKLTSGTDYTVSYKNNTKIGTATITVTGKGNYTGKKTLTFQIAPKKTTLSIKENSAQKATLTWKKSTGATGYQIYCSTNGGSYKKLATVKSADSVSRVVSNLNTDDNYYRFMVRPYTKSGSKTIYGSWSNVVTAG